MANEALPSDPVDPLHSLVGFSLFPSTIRASTGASVSLGDPKDLEAVHNFMKSMEMKSPKKLMAEAKAIVDNGGELLNIEFRSFMQCMGIDEDVAMKGKEKLQERRPGLGRKRAKFSLKASTSQPPVILGPSLDLDQLSDPMEFFAAVDKLEDAEKEIKRQRGMTINDPDVNIPPANARRRRPGILGKSVRYKHRSSSIQLENDASILSQETLERDVPADQNSQLLQDPCGLNVELQEADYTRSIKKTENKIDEILGELLSSNGEDLEGGMALSKLQERLQFKPIELGSLCIPEFPMTGKIDGKALGERIKNPKKFSLDVQDLVKRTTEGTPSTYRQHAESPANNLTSPTPPKSPFASLSLLKKRILQSNPLRDPFSPLNIDLYDNDLQSEHMPDRSLNKNVGPTESRYEKENLAGCDNTNVMVPLRGSDSLHEPLMEKNSGRDNVEIGPNGSQSGPEQHNGHDDINDVNLNMRNMDSLHQSAGLDKVKDVSVVNNSLKDQQGLETESYDNCQKMQDGEMLADTLPSLQEQEKADDTANCPIGTPVEGLGPIETDRRDGEMLADTLPSLQEQEKADDTANCSTGTPVEGLGPTETDRRYQVDHMLPETAQAAEQDHYFEDSARDLNNDLLNSVAVEVNSTEVRSKLPELTSQRHAQIHQANDKQQKAKRPAGRRREITTLSSRPSLADAGTSFENGVRRSKRTKTRPLEYWKGERLLYGRVNDSVKLVGLKYLSPGQGSLKVKSYLSDDYKDLVELAARY